MEWRGAPSTDSAPRRVSGTGGEVDQVALRPRLRQWIAPSASLAATCPPLLTTTAHANARVTQCHGDQGAEGLSCHQLISRLMGDHNAFWSFVVRQVAATRVVFSRCDRPLPGRGHRSAGNVARCSRLWDPATNSAALTREPHFAELKRNGPFVRRIEACSLLGKLSAPVWKRSGQRASQRQSLPSPLVASQKSDEPAKDAARTGFSR
jgi:hypothetical protein